MKSNSTTVISDVKLSATTDANSMKKSVSDVTHLGNRKTENQDKEPRENTLMPSPVSQRPNAVELPGIFISHFDPSDVDECDGGSLYGVEEPPPRRRCETYSAGCDTLMVRPVDGGGSGYSSSAGLFASQRSLPSSSKCSSRLGVCDSGWDGDVSHDGSLSTVSHKDWTDRLRTDAAQRLFTSTASVSLFPPFSHDRRHSTSNAEQRTSTLTSGGQREPTTEHDNSCKTRPLLVDSGTDGRSRDDSEPQRQPLRVLRSQAPGFHLSISSSRSLTGIESAALEVTVDGDSAADGRRSATSPRQRRPLRQRKRQRDDMTTDWIRNHFQQHTDDSEVERRVERLLYEIDHSVTDSVDESKIRSQEFEVMSH